QPFVLSIKSQFKANLLKVWPNPAKDKLFLDGSVNAETEVAVYNQIGMLVFKGKAIENQISLGGFKAGMYSLTATVKGQKVSAQFVVSQ
ncbi:MAG: T9SS type A sorting domain-containing protein, partial [Flexibacteraceae bacterium]